MSNEVAMVSIGSIDIPKDKPRKTYTPAGYKKLKDSVEFVGILAPLVVVRMPDKRFEVIDGSTRLTVARDLGWPPSKKVPVRIVKTDARGRVAAEIILNQVRERLPPICELFALRMLLRKGASQKGAAKLLCKTQGWAAQMASLDRLPKHIRNQIDDCQISTTHALAMVPYADKPEILDMLVNSSIRGNASTSDLKRIGETALSDGMTAAEKQVPKNRKVGKSSIRLEPRRNGVRIEINLNNEDDFEKVAAKAKVMAKQMKLASKGS